MYAEDRGFLSAMLGPRACEDTPDFAGKRAGFPDSTGGIEELTHLSAHVAKACGCANDDSIRFREFPGSTDRDMGKFLLMFRCPHLFQDFR